MKGFYEGYYFGLHGETSNLMEEFFSTFNLEGLDAVNDAIFICQFTDTCEYNLFLAFSRMRQFAEIVIEWDKEKFKNVIATQIKDMVKFWNINDCGLSTIFA